MENLQGRVRRLADGAGRGRAAATLVVGLMAVWPGCQPSSPEAVADRFIDYYVVEMDQARALPLCQGLAKDMLERELRDVTAVRAQMGGTMAEGRPDVFYRRLRTDSDGDRRIIRYEMTIKHGRDATQKNAQVAVSKVGEGWKVVFYHIGDGK